MCGCKANSDNRYVSKKQPKGIYKRKELSKETPVYHINKITYKTKVNYGM